MLKQRLVAGERLDVDHLELVEAAVRKIARRLEAMPEAERPRRLTCQGTIWRNRVAKHRPRKGKNARRKPAGSAKPLPGVELETVVFQLQKLMGPTATVEHNQRVRDRLGHLRQIDVLIRGTFGGWPILGVIECKDSSRPKGLEDVEAFAKKTEHLGAGLRLIVSKKGFAKTALRLAAHEHIACLSLLPHESHNFGFTIGDWWYGIVSRWTDLQLHIDFATHPPPQIPSGITTDDVLLQGKPAVNWFMREFFTTYKDFTVDGYARISVPFDKVTNIEIAGADYTVTGLSCSARGQYLKKRKWVTYSGQAFFDWATRKIQIPPGVTVHSQPIGEDLLLWEDYAGDIPAIEDSTGRALARAVFILTQYFDPKLPVPDVGALTSAETKVQRRQPPPRMTGFDITSESFRKVVEAASRAAGSVHAKGE